MLTDLRSDTVTRPTPEMLEFMMKAQVGDDVYGEDPTVNLLEAELASMFGHEAGLFCPSGTMTNQIAIKVHTQPGDELICADNAHVYKYEGGGIAFNSGVQARTIAGDRGRITAQQVQEVINGDDVHFPVSRLVCLENTNNRGGGSIYTLEAIREIRKVCDTHQLKLHLDGARIFNALVESDYSADMIGKCFHSVSVCLSKGLGAPVGSVLLGDAAFIKQARRVRKVFGGGMRQAGYLAAAGLYAVQHHIQRLKEDHRHAKQVQLWLKKLKGVKSIMPVDTNIIIFELESVELTNALHTHLQSLNILCNKVTASSIRFTFHLDINEDKMGGIEKALGTFVQKG